MKEFTCIVCPRGCHLVVDDNLKVSGNTCLRGKEYAINEVTHPTRTISTIIRVKNREHQMVSVKTTGPIPKDKIFDALNLINQISVNAPTHIGDVVIKNIFKSDIDVIITKEIE